MRRARVPPFPAASAKFDLSMGFRQAHDDDGAPAGIDAHFEYATDLFDPVTVRELAGRLTRLLRQAAEDPGRGVGEFDLLTGAERRLLAEWNETGREVARATVAELFERQPARTRRAPGVLSAAGGLSYGELNARANRLARYLASLGAGPERLVAVVMQRGVEVVVALLAVLEA